MITPYVKIDFSKVKNNISSMVISLANHHISHRPHIKPHKSVEFARLQIESGAIGITCATLTELDVMAKGGIDNILLAIPLIGEDQWNRLYDILSTYSFTFMIVVDSEIGMNGLAEIGKRLKRPINVLVAIDGGSHREGIQPENAVDFINKVVRREWLNFKGLFTYYGQIYQYDYVEQPRKAKDEASILLDVQKRVVAEVRHFDVLSGGSTVSSKYPEQLKGLTESRAGNYIFYDMNAVHLGIAELGQCALRVIAKVISIPIEGRATIDAGSKALSTDQPIKGSDYGYIVNKPELRIVKVNEEHGFIEYDPEKIDVSIGDMIEIIPNHACVIPNLYNQVFLFENDRMIKKIPVDARGRNY
ncbi:amino acid processing protein [bacterium LRH843]|nr:amino acid processing protein [bacterium LRH843]